MNTEETSSGYRQFALAVRGAAALALLLLMAALLAHVCWYAVLLGWSIV